MAKSHLFTSGICVLMSVTLGIGMVPSAAFAEVGISEADLASGVANAQFDGSDDSHVGSGDNDASPDKVTQSDGSPSASADRSSGGSCDGKEKSLGSEMPDGLTLAASESVPDQVDGASVASDDESTDLGGAYMLGFLDGQTRYLATGNPVELDHGVLYVKDSSDSGTCWELYEGQDYELDYYENEQGVRLDGAPSSIGSYKAVYRALGKYHGTRTYDFSIVDPFDIASYETSDQYDWEIVGSQGAMSPVLHMMFNPGTSGRDDVWYLQRQWESGLTQDVDFKVVGYAGLDRGQAPSEAGTYSLIVQGMGRYHGTVECSLRLFSRQLDFESDYSGAEVRDRYEWTGSPIQPYMIFYFQQEVSPIEGRDYELVCYDSDGNELSEPPTDACSFTYAPRALEGGRCTGEHSKRVNAEVLDPRWDLSNGTDSFWYDRTVYKTDPHQAIDFSYGLTGYYQGNYTSFDKGTDFDCVFYDSQGHELNGYPELDGSYTFKLVALPGGRCKGESDTRFSLTISDKHCISNTYWNTKSFNDMSLYNDSASRPCYYYGRDGVVEPKVQVSNLRDGNVWAYDQLVEGKDYVVTYSNSATPVDADVVATATITGIGDYYGGISMEYTVLSAIDLSRFYPVSRSVLRAGNEYADTSWNKDPQFFTTGSPVRPTVEMSRYFSDGTRYYDASSGFVVSYVDSEGRVVDPVEAGDYKAVLTGTGEGVFCGCAEVPFSLVDTKDLHSVDDVRYGNLTFAFDAGHSSLRAHQEQTPDGFLLYSVGACFDDIKSLGVKLRDSGRLLIEGVDYALTTVRDGVYRHLAIEGIGRYAGSVRATVYGQTRQEQFDSCDIGINRTVRGWVYNANVRDVVYASADGILEDPLVDCASLVEGVDFDVAGMVDASGVELRETAEDCAFVKLVGKGVYEGCERLIPVAVLRGDHEFDLSFPDACRFVVRDSVYNKEDGLTYVLESALQNVRLAVYGQNVMLQDGDGVTIESTMNPDGDSTRVTASAWNGSGMKGSYSQDYRVVDKLSLPDLVAFLGVSLGSGRGNGCPINDDGTFNIPSGIWPWSGFSYKPSISVYADYRNALDYASYSLKFFDESGQETEGIVGPGTYTVQILGQGDWEGCLTGTTTVADGAEINMNDVGTVLNGRTTFGDDWDIVVPLVDGVALPEVKQRYYDYELIEGRDYTLSFSDNTKEGIAAVTISAIQGSGFTGEKTLYFTCSNEIDIASAGYRIAVPDENGCLNYDGQKYSYMSDTLVTCPLSDGAACPDVALLAVGDRNFSSNLRGAGMVSLDSEHFDVQYGNNTKAGTAWVKVTGKNGYTGSLSANYRIVDFSAAPFTATAAVADAITNNQSTLTCSFAGASTNGVLYEWQGSADSGKTWFHSGCAGQGTPELKVASNEGNGKLLFRCKVTDNRGREACTDPVSILVLPKLSLDASSSKPVSGKSSLSVQVEGDAGYALSYVWQGSVDGGKSWFRSGCEGQGTSELKVPANAGNAKMLFRCVVGSADGREAVTSSLRISLGDPISVSVAALNPVDAKSPLRASVENAAGAPVSYVWQASANGGQSWFRSGCAGQGTSELKVPTNAGNAGLLFRCVATASDGRAATSDAVRISLGDPLCISVNSAYPFAGKAALSVTVSGAGSSRLSYEWQGSVNGVSWFRSGCEGQGTATLKVPANDGNAALRFRCVVTASDGRSAVSDAAAIIVNKPLNAFATSDAPIGGKSMLTANVFNADGSSLSYVWQASGDSGASWYRSGCQGQGTSQLFVPANSGNAGSLYRCVVTASDGRVSITDPVRIRLE